MKTHKKFDPGRDDVDQLVETLLTDPGRAEDIKTMLRDRLGLPREAVAVPREPRRARQVETADFWENFPV